MGLMSINKSYFSKKYVRLVKKTKANRILMLREDSLRLDFYVNANIDIFYMTMPHFFVLFQR